MTTQLRPPKVLSFSLLALVSSLTFNPLPTQAGLFETDFESGLPAGTTANGSASLDTVGGVTNSAVMKLTRAENNAETG
ncbi:MAG: hypothetical protein ABIR24_14940, partial [Verrucomicrobiota bacterium]